jgi:hypothetical protein
MGVEIEGSEEFWLNNSNDAVLSNFDKFNQQSYYIEIFNRGNTPFDFSIGVNYSAHIAKPWININPSSGKIETQDRIWLSVDWNEVPAGKHKIPITITGSEGSKVVVQTVIDNPSTPELSKIKGYIESNGYVSIEAVHYTNTIETNGISWKKIPNLGHTLSAMTPMPVTADNQMAGGNNPCLEYAMHLFTTGEVNVMVHLSPTLNFKNDQGLRYGISFDDEQPQIVNMHKGNTTPDWKYPQWWNEAVSNNIIILTSKHTIKNPGEHILKFWMVDPGVVLQKLVVETRRVRPSYLGPPESFYQPEKSDIGRK